MEIKKEMEQLKKAFITFVNECCNIDDELFTVIGVADYINRKIKIISFLLVIVFGYFVSLKINTLWIIASVMSMSFLVSVRFAALSMLGSIVKSKKR